MNKDVVTLQLLEVFKGKYCNKTLVQYFKNIEQTLNKLPCISLMFSEIFKCLNHSEFFT